MKGNIYTFSTPEKLKSFAAEFVEDAARRPRKTAVVISLVGNLGSGKTTFAQGAASAFSIVRSIPSPTFIIMREISLPKEVYGITKFYHFDWFRLFSPKDALVLGWEEIIKNPKNIVLVEWGDKFPELFPIGAHQITLSHSDGNRTALWKNL